MNIDGASLLFRPPSETQRVQTDSRSYSVRMLDQTGDDALEAFASEMAARLSVVPGDSTEGQENPKDPSVLAGSLKSTLSWIDERFGRDAMTAAAGMVMGSTQHEASEETLSNGLVRTLRMIENNFGTEAGNEAIAKFNGTLNDSLNNFFDNGKVEEFLAVTPDGMAFDGQNLTSVKRDFARYVAGQVEGQSNASTMDQSRELMESLADELEKSGLSETMAEELEQQYKQALQAYGWVAPTESLVLDMAV